MVNGESMLKRIGPALSSLKSYLGGDRRRRKMPIETPAALAEFLETRASHVAQTSLYGYLRTRAGVRFPELFADDVFVEMLNVAKWHVWAACLSDLAVFAGGLLVRHAGADGATASAIVKAMLEAIFERTGEPAEAGPEFPASRARVLERIAAVDWTAVADDDTPFTESPDALVHWAPIIDVLKEMDADIVKSSVRYRWQEIRRDLRRDLRAEAIIAAHAEAAAGADS